MRVNKPFAIFDLDDTLGGVMIRGEVRTSSDAYRDCIDRFVVRMKQIGFNEYEVREIQQATDVRLCETQGFGSTERFGLSFVETYERLAASRGGVHPALSDEFMAIGGSVFTDYPYVMLPGAADTLRRVRTKFNLAIVSKGNGPAQLRKIEQCGLMRFVPYWETFVVPFKNQHDWRIVASKLSLLDNPGTHWAIGNSFRSDVAIPMEMGLNGIVVNEAANWAFETSATRNPAVYPGQKFHEAGTIHDIPELLGV